MDSDNTGVIIERQVPAQQVVYRALRLKGINPAGRTHRLRKHKRVCADIRAHIKNNHAGANQLPE
jgi:hypothetical protein